MVLPPKEEPFLIKIPHECDYLTRYVLPPDREFYKRVATYFSLKNTVMKHIFIK